MVKMGEKELTGRQEGRKGVVRREETLERVARKIPRERGEGGGAGWEGRKKERREGRMKRRTEGL